MHYETDSCSLLVTWLASINQGRCLRAMNRLRDESRWKYPDSFWHLDE